MQISQCQHCPLRGRGSCFAVEVNNPRYCELVAPDSPRREAYTKFLEDRADGKPLQVAKPVTTSQVFEYPAGHGTGPDGAEIPPDRTLAAGGGGCGCGKERPRLNQERPKVRKPKPKP